MTNLASSIQVSEEALRVGAEMLCHNHSMLAGDEDAWRLHVDEARSIYLAMRSKDHSMAVDDVERGIERIYTENAIAAILRDHFIDEQDWRFAQAANQIAALVRSKLPIDREMVARALAPNAWASKDAGGCGVSLDGQINKSLADATAVLTAIGSQSIEGERG